MARAPLALGVLLILCLDSKAQLSPSRSPDPSPSPGPPCLLSPTSSPTLESGGGGDGAEDNSDRAVADSRLRAASARRAALNEQLDCLAAYETDLVASIDQLQGVVLPDTEAQLAQARAQRETLVTSRGNLLSMRKAREAENTALSQRVDALLARSAAAREEQMQLVDAAASGGEAARAEAERQERLVKEIRALVPRVEELRGQREAEKVRRDGSEGGGWAGGGSFGGV